MGENSSFAWIVAIPDDESVETGILTAKALLAVKTALDVVTVISSGVSRENIARLHDVFENVMIQNIPSDMLETGKDGRDALLRSILKTKSIRKAIVMAPGVLVSAQCDHLFDSQDDGILVQDKENKNWLMVRITPNSWKSKKLVQTLPDQKVNNLTTVLEKTGFTSQETLVALQINVQNIQKLEKEDGVKVFYLDASVDSGDKWAIWEQHFAFTHFPTTEDMNTKDWIAVIGMSCKFPKSNNLAEYWDLLDKGVHTTSHPHASRLSLVEGMTDRGNFLACPIDQFDARFFGMSPNEAALTDPQARLLLECSWEALEHANLNPDQLRGSQTGVFYGSWLQDYRDHMNQQNPAGQDFLRKYLANGLAGTAAKLSFFYGFTGPNVAIENACSTSLLSLHLACGSLRRRECPLALVCGTNLILHSCRQAKVLSHDRLCKSFDARADGYSRAEGIAILVLKRYSDAIRDGDKIQAVIRSSAINQEGLSKSFGTPTVESECRAMRAALANAGVDPSEVDYVEAHATGTGVGDPTEAAAIVNTYSSSEYRKRPLWIGSGKTNIGHTEACAGLAGIIKVILSLQHNKIPKHLHLTRLNPAVNFESIPGAIPVEAQPWPRNASRPRIAGVSSFGLSGTYAHAIIQEGPPQHNASQETNVGQGQSLLLLSAKSAAALQQLMERYTLYLEATSSCLQDICFTTATCRTHHSHRLALAASNKVDMLHKLLETLPPSKATNPTAPRIVFTCPGVIGKQKMAPIRHLYRSNFYFRQVMEECDSIFKEVNPSSGSLVELLFSINPLIDSVTPEYFLLHTTFQYAVAKLWNFWGLQAEMVVGHCQGEFGAALISGLLPLSEFYKLAPLYRILMEAQSQRKVQMMALNTELTSTEKHILDFAKSADNNDAWLDIACCNAKNQTVVIGPEQVTQIFSNFCTARGLNATPFVTYCPVHCRALEKVGLNILEILSTLNFQTTTDHTAFLSSTTGQLVHTLNATHLYRMLRQSVNFIAICDNLLAEQADGNFVLLEMSGNAALTKLANDSFKGSAVLPHCIPSFGGNSGTVLESLRKLYELGVNLNWQNFYRSMGFQGEKVSNLPGYPFQRKSYWLLEKKKVVTALPAKQDFKLKRQRDNWKLAPFYQPRQATTGAVATSRIIIEHLAVKLNKKNPYSEKESILDRDINRLCRLYIMKALCDLGCHNNGFKCVTPEEVILVAQKLGVVPHLSAALSHYVNLVFQLQESSPEVYWKESSEIEKKIKEIKNEPHVQEYAALSVITACGENLAGILNGRISPHKILFNPNTKLAEGYYRDTRFMKNYKIAAEMFEGLVSRWTNTGETLRILEVGAGTGLFTKLVLPHLLSRGSRFEYHFTDVSPTLLRQSKKSLVRLFSTDRMVFSVLNLENDALVQGFPPNYFDVVVAVDVIHATKNLLKTLTNLKRICGAGATVLLSETEIPIPELDVCFGILNGYWHFEDRELRPNHCTVSSKTWLNLLAQVGFTQEPTTVLCCNGQKSVVMASSPSVMKDEQSKMEQACEESWLLFEIGNQSDDYGDLDVRRMQSHVKKWSGRTVKYVRVDPEWEESGLLNWIRDQLLRVQNLEGILILSRRGEGRGTCTTSAAVSELSQRWLASTKSSVLPKLVLVTEDENSVLPWGDLKKLLVGVPALKAKCVHLGPTQDSGKLMEYLVMEMWVNDQEAEVSYDGGKRYVRKSPEVCHAKIPSPPPPSPVSIAKPKVTKTQGSMLESGQPESKTFSSLYSNANSTEEKRRVIKEFLLSKIFETLGIDEDEVRAHTNFQSMGMDSLMSIEFTSKIYSEVQDITGAAEDEEEDYINLKEHNTLKKLTQFLAAFLEEHETTNKAECIPYDKAASLEEKTEIVTKFVVSKLHQTLGLSQEEVHPYTKFESMGMDSILAIEFANKIYVDVEETVGKQLGDFIDLDEQNTLEKLVQFLIMTLEEN